LVVVDDREPKRVIHNGREFFPDLVVTRLDVGDVVEGNVCIERKTALDFAGSVNDKRIFDQAYNMKTNYDHSVVIMTGSFEDIRNNRYCNNFPVNRFIGAMSDLYMYYGVPVLRVENEKMFWRYCESLIRKSNGEAPTVIKKVKRGKGDIRIGVLMGVPNLGEKRARQILKIYTIHELCHATVDDLMTIKGIGRKRAQNIKEVFHDNERRT
jgi:Fanconi anemia group M protein